jgi:hypothetical protein
VIQRTEQQHRALRLTGLAERWGIAAMSAKDGD